MIDIEIFLSFLSQAATMERLAEMERRAEEVRAKKASMPPGEETVQETE